MSEVRLIRLTKSNDFDGTSPIALTRDSFVVSGQRNYSATVPGPGGVIASDIFGLFSAESPKMVGVAFSTANPRSVVRIIDPSNRPREEINLKPFFQYILMNPGDRLAVLSSEATPAGAVAVELTLAVNELNEAQQMEWALSHPPLAHHHTRLRISRRANFVPAMGDPAWLPVFVWNPVTNVLESTDETGNGPIPISALGTYLRFYGGIFSVRYSNSNNDGKLIVVENTTRAFYEGQTALTSARWSRTAYAAHDDLIALSATAAAGGGFVVADIEIVRVEPGDRLRARHAESEFTGGFNL